MSKKVISVFALPSHGTKDRVSGVDFARVIQPAKHLAKYKDPDVTFKVTVYDPAKDESMNWLEVAEKHDIIFFNYTAMPWEFAKMGMFARKFNRPLIMDCDDSIWDIMPDNPVYESFKKGSENLENFTAICREVDYMTTTSNYLRNAISRYTDKPTSKIKVFPNYIDLSLYNHRSEFRESKEIRLLHFGSTTHFIDLTEAAFEDGVDRIMKDYPTVVLKTVGALIPRYKYKWGMRYENSYGHQDVYSWIKERFPTFMDETDILVTPLQDNRYTRCKSSIKFLEGSSAIKPGCYSRIRQYEEVITDGVDGMLCDSAEEWYSKIKLLIDNKELRRSMGIKAYEKVKREHQIQDHTKDYANFFSSILQS